MDRAFEVEPKSLYAFKLARIFELRLNYLKFLELFEQARSACGGLPVINQSKQFVVSP